MPAPFTPVPDDAPVESGPDEHVASEPETHSDPSLPTMTDLRAIATDLDDIDEILARLDDDESALDDEPDPGGPVDPSETVAQHDPVDDPDPEDQDPLLATR